MLKSRLDFADVVNMRCRQLNRLRM